MRGSRPPHGSQASTALSTKVAGVSPPSSEIVVKHRALPPRCIAPATAEHQIGSLAEGSGRARFSGRWFIVSQGGDCLLDYAVASPDALMSMPLGASCSLIAAILQFILAASGSPAESECGSSVSVSTHAVVMAGLLVSICKAPGFSVVAADLALGHDSTVDGCGEAPDVTPHIDAAWRYKAMEVQRLLSATVGPALHDLVEVSSRQREDQLNSYTLSSMLDSADGGTGESIEHLMDPKTSALARGVFAAALGRTYSGLLEQALRILRQRGSRMVESMCIFDSSLELLARVVDPLESPSSSSPSQPFSERSDWRGAELIRVAADTARAANDNNFTFWCWTNGRRDFVAALGPSIAPLRVAAQLRAGMGADLPHGSSCGDTLGVVQLPLRWEAYDEASWAVLEVSRVLAEAFGVAFEWPADIARNGIEISWGPEGADHHYSPPALDPAAVSPIIDIGARSGPFGKCSAQSSQFGSGPGQLGNCSPRSIAPVAVAPASGLTSIAPCGAPPVGAAAATPLSPRVGRVPAKAAPISPRISPVRAAHLVATEAARAAVGHAIAKVISPRAAEASAKDYCASLVNRVQSKQSVKGTI